MITYTVTIQEVGGGLVGVDILAPPGRATAKEIEVANRLHATLLQFQQQSNAKLLKPWGKPGQDLGN